MSLKDHPYLSFDEYVKTVPEEHAEPLKDVYGISPIIEYADKLYNNNFIAKMKEDVLKATMIPEGYLMQGMDFALGKDQTVEIKVKLQQADGEGSWKDISPLNIKWETVDIWHPTYTEETMDNPFVGDPMFEE